MSFDQHMDTLNLLLPAPRTPMASQMPMPLPSHMLHLGITAHVPCHPYPIYCPLPLLHREEALTKPHWCLGREERGWIFVVEEWTSLDLHLHHSFFVADGNFNARAPYPPRTSLSSLSPFDVVVASSITTPSMWGSWPRINFVRASSCLSSLDGLPSHLWVCDA